MPEAAHSINWEQPEAFNSNLVEFVGKDLADRGTKIVIVIPVENAAAEPIVLAWQTVQQVIISMP